MTGRNHTSFVLFFIHREISFVYNFVCTRAFFIYEA